MKSVNIDGNGHVLDSTNDLAIRLATETLQSFFRLVVSYTNNRDNDGDHNDDDDDDADDDKLIYVDAGEHVGVLLNIER